MATTFQIKVAAITSQRQFNDDTKSKALLDRLYTLQSLGPENATAQQKLDAVLDWVLRSIKAAVTHDYIQTNRAGADATLEAQAAQTYDFV